MFQRPVHLQLFNVFGEIPAGHAHVNVLIPSQGVEFLDARFDVVSGDALTRSDGIQVDAVNHRLVGLDSLVRNIDAELFLRAKNGDPEPTLHDDLVLGAPQIDQLWRGIPMR